MKSRTSIVLVHRPGRKPGRAGAAWAGGASRTSLVMARVRWSWGGSDGLQGRGRSGGGPRLAEHQGEQDGQADAVGERHEGRLVVDQVARAAAAGVDQHGAEHRAEKRRQAEVDEV